jgi:hypothetical protein
MATVLYLDHDGNRISLEQYKAHQADPTYTQVHAYDNGRVRAVVTWIGRIVDPGSTFPDYYKLFKVEVWNYTEGGELAKDPGYPKFFPTRDKAVEEYNFFVARWSESELDDEGQLIEAGNTLTPPPPPNPDAPSSAPPADDDIAGVGAW